MGRVKRKSKLSKKELYDEEAKRRGAQDSTS